LNKEVILFRTDDGKDITFEDLLKKIYENSEAKQKSIENTVAHVAPMVQSLQDAVVILPYLTDLQNASIRNDDQVVKMAAIVQRGLVKSAKNKFNHEDFGGITADERKALLEQAKEMKSKPVPGAAASGE
jgi:hypothetical protein